MKLDGEIPRTIKNSPPHAGRVWKKTHESAVETYGEGRRAHIVAFAALKHSYKKEGDRGVPKERKGPSGPQAARGPTTPRKSTDPDRARGAEEGEGSKREYSRAYRRRRKRAESQSAGAERPYRGDVQHFVPPARLIARIACLAILASAIAGCDVLRAARGCENPPLSRAAPTPLLATPTPPAPRALSAAEREVRAREIGASERGHSLEEVVLVGAQPHGYVGLPVEVHAYRLATRDGRDSWIVYVDPSGRRVPEDALGLAWVTEGVRTHGKFEGGDLGGVVARSWSSDVLPVTFQVVAPPWDGPPPPLPPDASPEEWNAFVNRHRNAFYRPIVTPFIEQLRSLGAIVTDPTLAPGTYVVGAFVFANVRADQICALVRRDDVLRAYYAPASIY